MDVQERSFVLINSRVLICFDGSSSGLALLHLNSTSEGESSNGKNRRLLFTIDVVFIDDGGAFGEPESNRRNRTSEVLAVAEKLGFGDIMVASLEHAISDCDQIPLVKSHGEAPERYLPSDEERSKLEELFSRTRDCTAKQSLLRHLKKKLLMRIARENEFGKLFTSESSTSLAVSLLSGIATGRGMQIPSDVGFRDSTDPDVAVIRPMREFSSEEIDHYNGFHDHHGRAFKKPSFEVDGGGGIQGLTSFFVNGLQVITVL